MLFAAGMTVEQSYQVPLHMDADEKLWKAFLRLDLMMTQSKCVCCHFASIPVSLFLLKHSLHVWVINLNVTAKS